jgi:hypothetical protein
VAGVQGGVIHQYCDVLEDNYFKFKSIWQKLYNLNSMMLTKNDFVIIAMRADYEGLIWRGRKLSENYIATMTPEARESYYKSRGI